MATEPDDKGAAEALWGAARVLARMDTDWAKVRNESGFSKSDGPFGHNLALIPPDQWTVPIARDAYEMLTRYRVQLGATGIDMAMVPEPPDYPDKEVEVADSYTGGTRLTTAGRAEARVAADAIRNAASRKVAIREDQIVVDFKFDSELVAAVRGLPGREYVGATKSNVFPVTSAREVLAFAEAHGFAFPDELRSLAAAAPEAAAAGPEDGARGEKWVRIVGGKAVVGFPYDPERVESFKMAGGRRSVHWDASERHWEVQAYALNRVVRWAEAEGFDVAPEVAHLLDPAPKGELESRSVERAPMVPGLAPDRHLRPHEEAAVGRIARTRRILLAEDRAIDARFEALAGVAAAGALPAWVVCRPGDTVAWQQALEGLPSLAVSHPGFDALIEVMDHGELARRVTLVEGRSVTPPAGLIIDRLEELSAGRPAPHCPECERSVRPGEQTCGGGHRFDTPAWRYTVEHTDAVMRAAWSVPSDGVVVGLGSHDLLSDPAGLVNPLTALGWMRSFGGTKAFLERYSGAQRVGGRWQLGELTNGEELAERLAGSCTISRSRTEVGPELGSVGVRVVPLVPARDVVAEYGRSETALVRAAGAGRVPPVDVEDLWERRDELVPVLARLGRAAAAAAFDAGCDYVGGLLAREIDARLVCVVGDPERRDMLVQRLGPTAAAVGEVGSDQITLSTLNRFAKGEIRAVVVDPETIPRLASLEGARDVVLFDLVYDPAVYRDLCEACYGVGEPRSGAVAWQLVAEATAGAEIVRYVTTRLGAPVGAGDEVRLTLNPLAVDVFSRRMFLEATGALDGGVAVTSPPQSTGDVDLGAAPAEAAVRTSFVPRIRL